LARASWTGATINGRKACALLSNNTSQQPIMISNATRIGMSSHAAAAPIATSENSATRMTLAHTINRRRSKRSTITPAGNPMSSHGTNTAKVVRASSRGSSVRVSASSGMATKLIPSPRFEMTLAAHCSQ
jgi:hypothetical protein